MDLRAAATDRSGGVNPPGSVATGASGLKPLVTGSTGQVRFSEKQLPDDGSQETPLFFPVPGSSLTCGFGLLELSLASHVC